MVRSQPTVSPAQAGLSETDPLGRVVIENVQPEINSGRFPIKRVVGEEVVVTADIHADSQDVLTAVLRYRCVNENVWRESPMAERGNDGWTAQFTIETLADYEYSIQAWVDRCATWRKELGKKREAGQDVSNELLEGAQLFEAAAARAAGEDASVLRQTAATLKTNPDQASRVRLALSEKGATSIARYPDRERQSTYDHTLQVFVERERARFGAWYEMFPRSAGKDPKKGATLREAESGLREIAAMGFDVLYLPPIHPIGQSFRKGPNNALNAGPDDPGSPWAIGSAAGGHKAVHPDLGTLEDFDHFVKQAQKAGVEVALDLAYQCSPDHPYVKEHPEWFYQRPDKTIKYAENPPKKYEDIYPFNFECAASQALWNELRDIVLFWIDHGIKIFRADNPHTKPYTFWKWLIREVHQRHPDVIFLAEAFTRPKVMAYLAKCGFSQSYTYFTWRNTKAELTEYFTQLSQPPLREFMRPNLFTNTPDILHEFLQFGGRPAFQIRLFLAATLGASYGVYGPAFELCEARAIPGTEDYQDSEKYQIRSWDRDRPGSITEWIKIVNRIRHENPAIQYDHRLHFFPVTNDSMVCFAKTTPDLSNVILVVVNLDPHHVQEGWVQPVLKELGLEAGETYQVYDLLSDARYLWQGPSNFVRLDPAVCPAHIFRVRRKVKTEKDFDYFG